MIRAALRPLAGSGPGVARVRFALAGGALLMLAAAFACPAAWGATPTSIATDSARLPCNPPECSITGPDSICAGETAELCGPEGNYSYLWSTNETTRCITITTGGNYTLTVTDLATGCSSISSGGNVPTRTPWQMHNGLEVTPSNPLGLVQFSCSPAQNGDPCEYNVATIPLSADPGWGPAPDPDVIDFHIPSRVCQAPIQCLAYGDFTYFQTFVDIPVNVIVTQFTITFDGMDDGSRVTIFNSTYPAGLVVPGSYVFFGGTGTTNLAPYVVAGEVNRVVITQVDDCCSENNLRSAIVVLNGQTVTTQCGRFVRLGVCGTPPVAIDAFPIFDNDVTTEGRVDSVMVVFDRAVEKTSAENVANYSLSSSGAIDGARRLDAPDDDRVVLVVRDGPSDGYDESITVHDVLSLEDETPMAAAQTLYFYSGVLELDKVVAPDPNWLDDGKGGCWDRSRFSDGTRVSFIGTVTGVFGDDYTLQDVPSTRAGLWVHLPSGGLVRGHTYLMAGTLDEDAGLTRGVDITYVRGLGAGPSFVPSIQSIRVLTDGTCDDGQQFLTGEDYEGMLVTVDRAIILESAPAGSNFLVAIPGTVIPGGDVRRPLGGPVGPQDYILVANQGGNFTFTPTAGEIVTVTGVLGRVGGYFAIFPRGNADLVGEGPVPTFSTPLDVSKSATESRDPDIVRTANGGLFMAWWRLHHESVHSLSLDHTLNWSAAVPIMHQGAQPALAVTPSNKIGVLGASIDALFFKQSTDGGFQMDPLIKPVDAFSTRYPALTVGSGEHFHAAWERTGAGVFYARLLTEGAHFSVPDPIALNGPADANSMVRICASNDDDVFVFWQNDHSGAPRALYRRSLDGGQTFQPARQVRDESNPLSSTMKLAFLGDAQIGPDGTVYVMGLDEAGGVAFLRSTNDGLTFDLVGYLPEPGARGGLCPKSFAVGPGGEIHALVGVCGVALYYTRSTNGGVTWGPAVNVTGATSPTVGEPRGAKIILDGTGTPVIVWFSVVGGSTEIYSSRLLN